MKKFIFVLLFLFMPFMIKAVDIGITDTDINSITFNDDWVYVTRDNYRDVLANYNYSEADITNTYNKWVSQSYYMDAFTKDFSREIFLIVKDETSDVYNMNDLSDDEVYKETTELRNQYKAYNAEEDIFKVGSVKYLKMSYLDSNLNVYVIDYITIINNTLYQFKVQKGGSAFLSSEISEIEGIVSSTDYNIKSNSNDVSTNDDTTGNSLISTRNNTKKNNNTLNSALIGAIVGAVVGGVAGLIIKLTKKNKNNV